MNNIYYNYDKILSYNALLNFIIGERGVGKSYGAKLYVAKNFIKKGEEFVYIRRYKTEVQSAMMKQNVGIFFDQIKKDDAVKNHDLSNFAQYNCIISHFHQYQIYKVLTNCHNTFQFSFRSHKNHFIY